MISCERPNVSTDRKIVWVKVQIKGNNPFYIASYYKPHENDTQITLKFEKSLNLTRNLKQKPRNCPIYKKLTGLNLKLICRYLAKKS
jgi:hypothetical protein